MLRLSPLQVRQKVTIDDIFSEPDDLGLLVVEPLKIYSSTGNLPVSRLEEINALELFEQIDMPTVRKRC